MSSLAIYYLDMQALVDFTLAILRGLSPVGAADDRHPGLYRDSHMVFLDGHNVDNVAAWQPGRQINIASPVPYARKIEIGHMKLSVPSHIYEMAAQTVAGRYGNAASVKFTFMPVNFGSIAAYASFSRRERPGRRLSPKARQDWLVRQPSIEIKAR